MRIAIIPARGGSKRIPRKNIKSFCGKPMIAWPIEAAQHSGQFDRIIVSTDDNEIAEIARQSGAEVPFLRPDDLSDDHTSTAPVIRHALEMLAIDVRTPGAALCLYATSTSVTGKILRDAYARLESEDLNYVFAAQAFPHPIERAFRLNNEGRVTMIQPSAYMMRTQDLPPAYHDSGQFYWGRFSAWLMGTPIFTNGSHAFVLSRTNTIDIDTEEDWSRAEKAFRAARTAG